MRGFKVRGSMLGVAALLAACSSGDAAPVKAGGTAANPVVVELYQSQGCSSCPPANANLNAIAGQPGVLALSFAVTYWDQLGWKDSFARPDYTQRQWDYAKTSGRGNVATPQVVVNGKAMMLGGDKGHFARLIASGGPVGGPAIASDGRTVTIGAGKASRGATVWLVRYDPRVRNVAIRAGENGGRTLPHRNIVTDLRKLGPWSGSAAQFAVAPAADASIRSAILVQQGSGGPILAARKL